MTSPDRDGPPRILCAGIAVLDQVFRLDRFPSPDTKTEATEFVAVSGGCAGNAAIAIARLGGSARFAGPLGGPPGREPVSDQIVAYLEREGVACAGCERLAGASSPVSAIFIDPEGGRTIVSHRDERLNEVRPQDPERLVAGMDAVLADNRFPDFVAPICAAARRRGTTVVLDADKPMRRDDPLLACASHVIFSREALHGTARTDDFAAGLAELGKTSGAFLAVTDGANDILWRDREQSGRMPVFAVKAIDTLAAGDIFHGAFALAVVEGRSLAEALRFASAASAIKCARFGGSAAAPNRAELESFLADQAESAGEGTGARIVL